MLESQRVRVPCFLYADYLLRKPDRPERLYVLLHGYAESGERIHRKLESVLPPGSAVLAPNGPFPMPRRKEDRVSVGFSWYFYNQQTDEYFMDMEVGIRFIEGLIESVGLKDIPTTLIGFSQGGYIAPFIAQRMPQIDQVIGIACQFLKEEMTLPVSFRMDAIHGDQDEVVSAEIAQRMHDKLTKDGVCGEFRLLNGTAHRIDDAMRAALSEMVRKPVSS